MPAHRRPLPLEKATLSTQQEPHRLPVSGKSGFFEAPLFSAVGDADGRNPGLKTLPVMDRWLLAYRQMVMLMNGNYRGLRKYSDCQY